MVHTLDSTMIYIHPTLSIIGYLLVFLSFVFVLVERIHGKQIMYAKICLYCAWLFNLAGLLSGMLWAQIAWGSYWSWDPKETLTLFLFISIGSSAIFYEKRKKTLFLLLLIAIALIVLNIAVTFSDLGLHSYNL